MKYTKLSLRTTLIGIFVILNVVAASIIGILVYLNSTNSSAFMVTRLQQNIFRRVNEQISFLLDQTEKINLNNANLIRQGIVPADDLAKLQYLFWQQIKVVESVSNITFGNPAGGIVAAGNKVSNDGLFLVNTIDLTRGTFLIYDVDDTGKKGKLLYKKGDFDVRQRPWYVAALQNTGNVWTSTYRLPMEQFSTISVNLAVRDNQHRLLGVLSTNLFTEHLNQHLRNLEDRAGGQVYIVDGSGELIASSLPAIAADQENSSENQEQTGLTKHILSLLDSQLEKDENSLITQYQGKKYHVYTSSLLPEKQLGWYTIIEFPDCCFMPELKNSDQYVLITILAILSLTALMGLLAARYITSPIKSLENTACKIARGVWHTEAIPPTHITEIDSLTDSFKNMATTLEEVVLEFQDEINIRREAEENLKISEKALRVKNEMYEKLTGAAKDAIIQMNDSGEIVFWNNAASAIFGYTEEEVVGQKVHTLLAQSHDLQSFMTAFPQFIAMGTGHAIGRTIELKAVHKDGHLIPVELSLSTFIDHEQRQALAIIRDISDRKASESRRLELEEQLRQKYKIEAVGLLAGGIAHNFNNNLAIILGNVEMAKHHDVSPEDSAILLDNAYTAARRSSDLVKQIMTYTRSESFAAEPVQLQMIIKETLTLLYSTLPSSVNLQSYFCAESHKIFIDADLGSIQEIVINLCNNAIHAMDEQGNLSVTLDLVDLEPADIPAQFQCQPGRYARISVKDTGMGMSKQVLAKIFDPFFTTKDVDQGTGMGLATVMGAVKNYGGLIKVSSTVGQGSCFAIYFPQITLDNTNEPKEDIPLYKGSGTILLVDDNPLLADTSCKMLDKLGYQVTMETSIQKALASLNKSPFKYDLIITDQTMPGMTGTDFARKMKKINPALPIILCTGYSNKVSEQNYRNYSNIKGFCMKPLTLTEFSQAVNNILNG